MAKALSVRQPWAWMIVNGFKDIENRPRRMNYRGELLIHASLTIDKAAHDEFMKEGWGDAGLPSIEEIKTGGLVGKCEVIGCVERSASPWFSGPFGIQIQKARVLPFRPYTGQLGLFTVNEEELWTK